ncbi:MAG TPA: cytochrome P450 [Alphaproteobacteria bacterium]|nr:cytochrome P450 [Alphaproteobacteria bacterium]
MGNIAPVMPEVDFGTDPLEDLYERIAILREQGHRVVPVRYIGETAWLILRYDDVTATFADEKHLPAADAYERTGMPSMGRILMAMRGEQHRVNRALAGSALLPGAIRRATESLLLPLANGLIDRFAERREIDLVAAYTRPYPFNVISRLLGVPIEDEGWIVGSLDRIIRLQWDREGALRARAELDEYLIPIVEKRRREPGEDLISQLATAEVEGRRLDQEEILSFLRLLYPAGAETTFLTMSALMREILTDRALYDRLIAHPEDRVAAVEEALRKEAPATMLPRYATNPVTIGGVEIPAGALLLLGSGAANHDPDVFPDPESFSLQRGANPHATFGRGAHFCMGSHLAREELRISLTLLLGRLPGLRLVGPPGRSVGTVVRGIRTLPVAFDDLLPAIDYIPPARKGAA